MTEPEGVSAATCRSIAEAAARDKQALRLLTAAERADLLHAMAESLRRSERNVLDANTLDMQAGAELSPAMRDRLLLDPARFRAMAHAVDAIARQPDPVGGVVESRTLSSGIRLEKRRVPIGVVLVIYESRPNVTSDAAALCLKAGNAVVLRGGKESANSNRAIVDAIRTPLRTRGLEGAVGFIDTPDRSAIDALVRMEGVIDVVIPRGGPGLIRAVAESALIPVIKHDAGNCHVYVDQHLVGLEDAAVMIVVNAKAQRPGVCNAAETLLVHAAVADRMLPLLCGALASAGVEIRGDERTRRAFPDAKPASDADWAAEYLDLIIAVRVVGSIEEAAAHIRKWGSRHTEAIITSSAQEAERFVALVDSASVMVNCSTRFADGGEYGLGAEIGVSTGALHARGPMGAADLTTTQWVLIGHGQTRGDGPKNIENSPGRAREA